MLRVAGREPKSVFATKSWRFAPRRRGADPAVVEAEAAAAAASVEVLALGLLRLSTESLVSPEALQAFVNYELNVAAGVAAGTARI